MSVLLFNLRTDADDGVLGFTTTWINGLATYCESITVITMYVGRVDVAANVTVHSVGKERGYSRVRRLMEFYRLALAVLRRERVDVVFSHMAPLFAVLFAPIARVRRIPIVLWHAHKSTPLTLRLAHRLVDSCVASTPEGFRIPSRKVRFIGQGVDTTMFRPPRRTTSDYEATVLSIGRIAPIKNIHEIMDAVEIVRQSGIALKLRLTGGPETEMDREYLAMLKRFSSRTQSRSVVFEGLVAFRDVPKQYRRGGIFVNLSESGSLDKAILEGMASGCIPICRNDAFRRLAVDHGLEELVPLSGSHAVADCLTKILSHDPREKEALRAKLRGIVVQEHRLEGLIERIAMILADQRSQRTAPASETKSLERVP